MLTSVNRSLMSALVSKKRNAALAFSGFENLITRILEHKRRPHVFQNVVVDHEDEALGR